MNEKSRSIIHWTLALIVTWIALTFIFGSIANIDHAIQTEHGKVSAGIPYNELSRQALESRLDHAKTLLSLAVGLLGGIGALLLLKPQETRWVIGNAQQGLMLASSIAVLVMSGVVTSFVTVQADAWGRRLGADLPQVAASQVRTR